MCKILKISRSLVYYTPVEKTFDTELENKIIEIFKSSRNNYGTRKIKVELNKVGLNASRRRIGRIMAKYGLVSNYTVKQYKHHNPKCNEEVVENIVNREFDDRKILEVVVSDLTYINVAGMWNYICIMVDICTRRIIGYAAGKHKDSQLVQRAFASITEPLDQINIFHTDRGNEFKNKIIDKLLTAFTFKRSLSKKGCPYDNAIAEATFKIVKTEFAFNKIFDSYDQLEYLLFDYVNWYNNHRIHGSLNYKTPAQYKLLMSE
jgi:transposase InsO family protein